MVTYEGCEEGMRADRDQPGGRQDCVLAVAGLATRHLGRGMVGEVWAVDMNGGTWLFERSS